MTNDRHFDRRCKINADRRAARAAKIAAAVPAPVMTHEEALRAILARLDGSNSTAAELRAMRSECQTIAREALEPQRLSSKGLAFQFRDEPVERIELAGGVNLPQLLGSKKDRA